MNLHSQRPGSHLAYLLVQGILMLCIIVTSNCPAWSQTLNDPLRFSRTPFDKSTVLTPLPPVADEYQFYADSTLPPWEVLVNADYNGRVAIYSDSVRMADFAKGRFLPSAIPAAGEPFYDSGSRANLQGGGNAVRLNAYTPTRSPVAASLHTQLLVQGADLGASGDFDGGSVTISQAFATLDRFSFGVMESAFADPAAVPETLDLAGPNARTTIFPAGLGEGHGRVSYDFLSDGSSGGPRVTVSLEQPDPEISTSATTGTYSRYPDVVGAAQYVAGELVPIDGQCVFTETWHVQAATVFRSLGLENDSNTFDQEVFGWGTSLSGAYRFPLNRSPQSLDRVVFSVTYGEGISHYITDLNNSGEGDAVVNTAGMLEPLPVFAWYVGYTHNWTDFLRSTATYSQVNLDSLPSGPGDPSPYQSGEYLAVNLLFHRPLLPSKPFEHIFYMGVEYLYGQKETLAGDSGDAHRVMWVMALSN